MSDVSDEYKDGDIFDHIDSDESDIENNEVKNNKQTNRGHFKMQNDPVYHQNDKNAKLIIQRNKEISDLPLPMLEGAHSLGPDMKFGWKPEVDFESAPIPLYFNFVEHQIYQPQYKVIYYGPRFKDSFEMHKNFVRPAENTYEFAFPKFYGLGSTKSFYDSVFEDMLGREIPIRDNWREFSGMSPDVEKNDLHFNSNFENGNLDMVFKTGDETYDLYLRADTNTRGHFGWFHFEVNKTMKGRTIHFNIVNMNKRDSLFNHGMSVNYWSQQKNSYAFCGWEKGGTNIRYGNIQGNSRQRKYYCLSFDFTFDYDNDKVWFAYTLPYSYSMCIQYLKSIASEQRNWIEHEKIKQREYEEAEKKPLKLRGKVFQESVLCKTLGGVDVPLVTITNFEDENWQKIKKVVFIQARVHPGETASSWITHGLISFLISKSNVAYKLRQRLVFKIIPMLNPDGVIIGNTRTTLLGTDMNRRFNQGEDADPKLNPVPNAIKDLIASLIKEDKDKILAFMDLHQHSKKKSIFIYGPYFPLHQDNYLQVRIIPKLLSERTEIFRFFSSRFRIDRFKENCSRITLAKMFNIINCFTLECSSYGYITKERDTVQFKEEHLIDFGKSLAECFLEYDLLIEKDKRAKREIRERIKKKKINRKATLKEVFGDSPTKFGDSPTKSKHNKSKNKIVEAESGNESVVDESDENESSRSDSDDNENFTGEYLKNKSQIMTNDIQDQSPKKNDNEQNEQQEEDEDKFYSDEEEDESSSPVSKPSDLKGLLKHKQRKSKFDLNAYTHSNQPKSKSSKTRTLDQLLSMIQSDIIHEESENDSYRNIGDSSSDREGNLSDSSDGDDLVLQDYNVLKERVLHAIQVFSKYSPNPKKEILKKLRNKRLSIENKSRESSKKSNRSETKLSEHFSVCGSPEKVLQSVKAEQRSATFLFNQQKQLLNRKVSMNQKRQIIDSFIKEFGIDQNQNTEIAEGNNYQPHESEEAIQSAEVSKQKKKILKKKNLQKGQSGDSGDLLMVKSFGINQKGRVNQQTQGQIQTTQELIQESKVTPPLISELHQHLNKLDSIMAGQTRKIILQKVSTKDLNQPNQINDLSGLQNHNHILRPQQEHLSAKLVSFLDQAKKKQSILSNNQEDNVDNNNALKPEQKENQQKNNHFLANENKFALLNQAILMKRNQAQHKNLNNIIQNVNQGVRSLNSSFGKHFRTSSFDQQQQILYSQNNKGLSANQQQSPEKIELKNFQERKNSESYARQSQNNQSLHLIKTNSKFIQRQKRQSIDHISIPLFSQQIHPLPGNQNPIYYQRCMRNSINHNSKNPIRIKLNAATDMTSQKNDIIINQKELSKLVIPQKNVLPLSSDRLNKSFDTFDSYKQLPNEKEFKDLESDNYALFIGRNININNGYRNIISSQSKARQLQIDKIQTLINQSNNIRSKNGIEIDCIEEERKKKGSIQEYMDKQQIGLHQWMKLSQEGILPQTQASNQLLVSNSIKYQPYQTLSDLKWSLIMENSNNKNSHQYNSVVITPEVRLSPIQKTQLNIDSKLKEYNRNNRNNNKSHQSFEPPRDNNKTQNNTQQQKLSSIQGTIIKGKINQIKKKSFENTTDVSFKDLVIKNEYRKDQNKFYGQITAPNSNQILAYIESNKPQIVQEIMLKSGGKILEQDVKQAIKISMRFPKSFNQLAYQQLKDKSEQCNL